MSEKSPERDVLELVKGPTSEKTSCSDEGLATTPDAPQSDEAKPESSAKADDNASSGMPPGEAQITAPADLSDEDFERLRADIVAALKTVYDPEIPSDIYELGLIYRVDITDSRDIDVVMTLTAPGCPVAGEMPIWVENAVSAVAGVGNVTVSLVFDPPWDMSRMSDEARLALNMF